VGDDVITMMVSGLNRSVATPPWFRSNRRTYLDGSQQCKWQLSLYCACRSDMRLHNWPYRSRAALNAQDMKRLTFFW